MGSAADFGFFLLLLSFLSFGALPLVEPPPADMFEPPGEEPPVAGFLLGLFAPPAGAFAPPVRVPSVEPRAPDAPLVPVAPPAAVVGVEVELVASLLEPSPPHAAKTSADAARTEANAATARFPGRTITCI